MAIFPHRLQADLTSHLQAVSAHLYVIVTALCSLNMALTTTANKCDAFGHKAYLAQSHQFGAHISGATHQGMHKHLIDFGQYDAHHCWPERVPLNLSPNQLALPVLSCCAELLLLQLRRAWSWLAGTAV